MQAYNFQQSQSYGHRLLKGITRDQIFNQILKYPLLVNYYKKNDLQIQNRIIDTLMRQPSQSDCPGFIYGFKDYNEHTKNPYADKYEIKMGRTKRQVPQNRIYEWQNQDGHQYVQLFTIRSEHNNKLEHLVHLFFAYARKTKFINGKRRIEWFSFDEKALNAAVTAMINELMEKVHQIATSNQANPPTLSFQLEEFLTSISEDVLSAAFVIKRLLIFGLKECGKSTVKAMLEGEAINAVKVVMKQGDLFESASKMELNLPENRDAYKNIYQLDFGSQISKIIQTESKQQVLKMLKKSFLTWSYVNNVEQLAIPCFVVTENDLMSSQLLAFRSSLAKFMSFIKYSGQNSIQNVVENGQNFLRPNQGQKALKEISDFKLFMVITKISPCHNYSEQKLKEFFLSKKQLFEPQQLTILFNASIEFTYQAQAEGPYVYNIEQFINKIQGLEVDKFQSLSFQFSDPTILKICQEISHFGYEDLNLMFSDYLKAALKKIIKASETQLMLSQLELNSSSKNNNEDSQVKQAIRSIKLAQDKLVFLQKIVNLVMQIKKSRKQQQIVLNVKKLQLLLEFSQKDQVFSQLMIFCECMIKTGSLHLVQEAKDENQTSKQISRIWSPAYLSNSLIFSRVLEKIEETKEEIRSEMNQIIESQVKQAFEKVTKGVYDELYKRPHDQNRIFDQVYNILFSLMNIHETVQSFRVERKLAKENVSNQRLEEQVLVKSLCDLHNILSTDSKHSNCQQYKSISEIINLIYSVSKRHKIRTNSIISRIKEAIFVTTKETKPIPMIESHSHDNHSHDTTINLINGNNSNKNKKPYAHRNNSNTILVNGEVKMIMNKKNGAKNQRLINYINSKKTVTSQNLNNQTNHSQQVIPPQQQKPEQIYPELKPTKTHTYQTRNSSKSINTNSLTQKKQFAQQLILPEQNNQDFAQISYEEFMVSTQKNGKKVEQLSQDDEFYSIEEKDSEEEKDLKENTTFEQSFQMEQNSNMTIIEGEDINENYLSFISQLAIPNSQIVKTNFNLNLLKDLYTHSLFSIEQQKRFTDIVFNHFNASFYIDLPSIVFHNAFVIIFAKKIVVDPFALFASCNIDFKVHYKNKKPTKVHVILVSEGFDGMEKLKVQDNRLGKMLMVQVTRQSQSKYRVLDGYYTKNKRNEKKLTNLKVNELVEAFCQIIQ